VLRPAHVEYNNSKRMRLYTLWQGGTCILADGATDAPTLLCARHAVTWLELSPLHGASLLAATRRARPAARRHARAHRRGPRLRSRCGVRSSRT
jgi:hypothetical protein